MNCKKLQLLAIPGQKVNDVSRFGKQWYDSSKIRYTLEQEMAQQVRELAAKPDDLALMPRTHIIEGKN